MPVQRATASNLKPEDMIKTLFIFSDMEFDECTSPPQDDFINSYFNMSLEQPKPRKREPTTYEAVKVTF